MLTEINLYMPYSFHKLAKIPPGSSYLGQLVIIRDIVKGLLTWPYSFDSIEFCENLIYDCMHSYEC